jgi:mitochondrial fission protein ELM1
MGESVSNQPLSPIIWVIWGEKAGDNAQISAILEALACPAVLKHVQVTPRYETAKPFFHASIRHLDLNTSASLAPPWPDLIITAGRRPAMAGLWVKQQTGGKTKLVLIGRPKRWIHKYDLIVASAQYELPRRSNIVPLKLPLLAIDPDELVKAGELWRERLQALPQPITALMIGGATRPYTLDETTVRNLLRQALIVSRGTLYVVTSRRTPPAVYRVLEEVGDDPKLTVYDWRSGDNNPYKALLGAADQVIVTGDSVSMITEAVRANRQLLIYELPEKADRIGRSIDWILGGTDWAQPNLLQRLMARFGLASFPRNLSQLHHWLYDKGLAQPLPDDVANVATQKVMRDQALADEINIDTDVRNVARRVMALACPDPAATGL